MSKKITITDEQIEHIRTRRNDLLFQLFENERILMPDVVFQVVMEIRNLTKFLRMINVVL